MKLREVIKGDKTIQQQCRSSFLQRFICRCVWIWQTTNYILIWSCAAVGKSPKNIISSPGMSYYDCLPSVTRLLSFNHRCVSMSCATVQTVGLQYWELGEHPHSSGCFKNICWNTHQTNTTSRRTALHLSYKWYLQHTHTHSSFSLLASHAACLLSCPRLPPHIQSSCTFSCLHKQPALPLWCLYAPC